MRLAILQHKIESLAFTAQAHITFTFINKTLLLHYIKMSLNF
jgi:hypothetical protein